MAVQLKPVIPDVYNTTFGLDFFDSDLLRCAHSCFQFDM